MHEPGFNYRLTDIQCALGISQLRKLDAFLEERRKIAKYYDQAFAGHPYIQTPTVTRYARHAYHLYPLLIDFDHVGLPKRDFFARMNEKGISLQVHYIPVHLQPYYRRKYGFRPGDCPVSESIYAREVSIPMHPGLTGDDIAYISQAILETLRT